MKLVNSICHIGRYLVKSACIYFSIGSLYVAAAWVVLAWLGPHLALPSMADTIASSQQGIGFRAGASETPTVSPRRPPTVTQAWSYIHQQADALTAYKNDLETTGILDPRAHTNFINREMDLQATNALDAP